MYHPYRYPRSEYYRPACRAPRDNDDSGRYYRPSDTAYHATARLRPSTRQADTRNEITLDELIAQASANVTNSSGSSRQIPPRTVVLPPMLGAELPQPGEDRPLGDRDTDRSGSNIAPSRRIIADGLIEDRPQPHSTNSTSDAAIEPGIEERAYGNQSVEDDTGTAENNTGAEDQTSVSCEEEGQPTYHSAVELEANTYRPEQDPAHTANSTLSAQLASPEPTISVDESPPIDALEKCKAYERVIARLGSGYIQAQNRLKALSSMSEDPESKAESEAVCTEIASGSNLAFRYLREYPTTLSRLRPCSNGQLKSDFSDYQMPHLLRLQRLACLLKTFWRPGLKSLWEKIEQSSLDINMEHYQQTLHYDEEWRRRFSNRESGSTASHKSGEGSQMAATFKTLKVETDGGSNREQIAPSAIQKLSKGLSPRGAMDNDSLLPVNSIGSSPASNQAPNDFTQSSDERTIPTFPSKKCFERNAPKKRLAGQLDSEESHEGSVYLSTVEKKRRI
ncbi:MAG: hypothetical protein Q9192_005763 [Flavoplaca navasiana]